MRIRKRNGDVVDFDVNKIINAIRKANNAVAPEDSLLEEDIIAIANEIKDYVALKSRIFSVEEIQDMVEDKLMDYGRHEMAKAYITYRFRHKLARDHYNDLMDEVAVKLNATDVQNQNANVDEHSFSGRMGEVTRLVLKRFALENCMSEMARRNHENNEIYIHDLDSYAAGMHNCLSLPIDDLLKNGFATRQGDVRPARSIGTAFQLVAVLFQLQSLEQFGGVSATHLDWSMVPYVRISFYKHYRDAIEIIQKGKIDSRKITEETSIDAEEYKKNQEAYDYAMKMLIRDTYQAVEGFYHNLKILGRLNSNVKDLVI